MLSGLHSSLAHDLRRLPLVSADLSGLIFFLVAMSGASAMVATFIGGMYGTAVGGVYALAQSASKNARLRGEQQRARMRHREYAHYD